MFWSIFLQSLAVIAIVLVLGSAIAYLLSKATRGR